jgi:ribosomal protein L40E
MRRAATLNRLSFRRWYERQLLESHAWLVTCILCAVAVAVLAAGYLSFRRLGVELLVTLGAIYAAGLLSLHAWRRYSALMAQAQHVAEASTCRACGAQGQFDVAPPVSTPMGVVCRKCGHRWVVR